METFPQYLTYNPATVTINDSYVVTNIQTRGLPEKYCGAHLESIEISSGAVGQDNPDALGTSGSVSLVDFRESVFDTLRGKLTDFLANKDKPNEYLSTISIKICTFTGEKEWFGHITNWQLDFVGTTPTLKLEWTSILPSNKDFENSPDKQEFRSPDAFLDAVKKCNFNPTIDFEVPAGKTLKFKDGKQSIKVDLSKLTSCGNRQVDMYNYLLRECVADSGEQVAGQYDDKTKKFTVKFKGDNDVVSNTEEGRVTDGIAFVQNGSYPYYKSSKTKAGERLVIPMTSFSYSASMSNLVLETRISNNPNGMTLTPVAGNAASREVQPNAPATDGTASNAANSEASGIKVSFDCYNTLTFSMNTPSQPVYYEVYNEFGDFHIVSGKGTVEQCSFSLGKEGVVKVHVEATEVYGSDEPVNEGGQGSVENPGATETVETATAGFDFSDEEADTSMYESTQSTNLTYEEYLAEEDDFAIPLSADKTSSVLGTSEFNSTITNFLDQYGQKTGSDRLIKESHLNKWVENKYYGLVALVLARSHYGIALDSNLIGDLEDPVTRDPAFTSAKPFFADPTNHSPFELDNGFGITQFDGQYFADVYTTFGFPYRFGVESDPTLANKTGQELQKLIVASPKKAKLKAEYPGKFVKWTTRKYHGQDREFPVFQPKTYMHPFDKELTSNTSWMSWANNILYLNDGDNYTCQTELITKWMEKIWIPVVKKLRTTVPRKDHAYSIQDAIRISRAVAFDPNLLDYMCGANVAEQYLLYEGDGSIKNTNLQKAFCKRACHIAQILYLQTLNKG